MAEPAVNSTAPKVAVAAGYCHAIMVAGTVLTAAAAEMLIRHPFDRVRMSSSLILIGGVALYVAGRTLFGVVMFNVRRPRHGPLALLAIAIVTPGLLFVPPLVVAGVLAVVLGVLVPSYGRTTAPRVSEQT